MFFWSQALQRELEALASTLVMRPIQPKSWPLFEAVEMVWRVPAVMLFLLFMGKDSERGGERGCQLVLDCRFGGWRASFRGILTKIAPKSLAELHRLTCFCRVSCRLLLRLASYVYLLARFWFILGLGRQV